MRYPGMAAFPAIGNPDFLAVASDAFITQTIHHGRPGRRMPAWGEKEGGLRPEEIKSVVAHLRELGGNVAQEPDTKPSRWAKGDVTTGARIYTASCASCHGVNGQGAEGPSLNNAALLAAATDTYLFETIHRGRRGTSMNGFGKASTVHAALTLGEIEAVVSFIRTWEKTK
jgi:cytochrome c oxidase cbb3-type subunit 3